MTDEDVILYIYFFYTTSILKLYYVNMFMMENGVKIVVR